MDHPAIGSPRTVLCHRDVRARRRARRPWIKIHDLLRGKVRIKAGREAAPGFRSWSVEQTIADDLISGSLPLEGSHSSIG